MIKTKIKKAIAIAWVVAIAATSSLGWALNNTYAASQIGTGSVTGTGGFDSAIIWDDLFPGTATGTVSGISIKAKVLPTLTMEISTGTIDLGTLVASVASTGSLFIEIGTNAKAGVSITARSGSGWLTNTSDPTLKIQDNQDVGFDDGVDESYTFESVANVVDDSSSPAFTVGTVLAATEINENAFEHIIYSTNKAENTNAVDDLEFIVSATSVTETAAWDYEDNVTFTVVGNF